MNPLFTIPQNLHSLIHSYAFIGSFIVCVIVYSYFGHKRNYPLLPWIAALSAIYIFATIGGKLLSFNADDWKYIFENFALPQTSKKRLFGYLLFALLGFILTKRILKFNWKFLDVIAFVWPIRLMITRIGCLFEGC